MKKSTSPVRRRRNGGRKPISSANGRPGKPKGRTERDRRACRLKHPAPKTYARETKQEPAKKPRRSLAPKRRPPRENSRETAGQRARYRECVAKDKTPAPHRRKRACSHDHCGRGVTRFAANMAAVKHERRCRAVQSKGAV